MKAKFRLLDTGKGTYIELDGKTMGRGIDEVAYRKVAGEPAEVTIHIDDMDVFRFEPDGKFDEVERKVNEYEPLDSDNTKRL